MQAWSRADLGRTSTLDLRFGLHCFRAPRALQFSPALCYAALRMLRYIYNMRVTKLKYVYAFFALSYIVGQGRAEEKPPMCMAARARSTRGQRAHRMRTPVGLANAIWTHLKPLMLVPVCVK